MTRYILSEDADRDLDGIWDHIAADNVDAADRWIGKLFDASDAIGETPGLGHKREDLTAYSVLFWPVGAYLVIYRAISQPVEIVAVTQGSRDIPAFPSDWPYTECRFSFIRFFLNFGAGSALQRPASN